MKNIYKYITLSFIAALTFTGCHERYVTYSDAEYVMFADTTAVYPVQKEDSTFVIPVVSTVKRNYDRTFGVEIVDKGNNAIERRHFHLESNTVTIKAGQTRADVLVHGHYSNIEATDSLGFQLNLVMNDKLVMPLYGNSTKAVLMKSCPFDVSNFTGWCMLTSMFLFQYPNASNPASYQRLIYTEPHPLKPNTIICRNWLNDGYDVTMTFHVDNPLEPFVTMDEGQVASDEGSFFGQTHGDDRILVTTSQLYDSIYYPCGSYLYIWTMMYVENLGTAVGTVGHFYNIMEWISDEEADRIKREEGI